MARKTIIQLRLEVHVPDAALEPEDLTLALINDFGVDAGEYGGTLIVVRTNSYLEPEPEVELPMLPDPVPTFPPTMVSFDGVTETEQP